MFEIPKNIKCILFDMDGTLVDSEPIGLQNFIKYFAKFEVKVSDQEVALFSKIWRREISGYNQDEYLFSVAQKYNLDIQKDIFLSGFYYNYLKLLIQAEKLPGVDDFLQKISENNLKIGLVTASKKSQVNKVLKYNGWQNIFDQIITKEDTDKHKPDPEPYLLGLKKLSAKPEETLIFEDSKNGVLSGKSAGCFVIGLKVGNKNQDLSQADIILNDLTELNLD